MKNCHNYGVSKGIENLNKSLIINFKNIIGRGSQSALK